MKLDEPFYAIVTPGGYVAGDGESPCVYHNEASAREHLEGDFGNFLRGVNCVNGLRVVRVRLVTDSGESTAGNPAEGEAGRA